MIPKRIGLASRSNFVSLADLTRVAAALNLQVQRDFQPIWNLSATVVALPDPESIEPGVWPIFIVDADDPELQGALGLHLTDRNQPYALVQSGPTWSLTAAHETLEMLADPSGNWLIPSAGIEIAHGDVQDRADAKFEYLVEVADPSEGPDNAYMIDDVLVTDFYTPHFFDHAMSEGVRYSFSGKIKRPRQVLPGGYISWLDPERQMMQQLRWLGPTPEIVDLPGVPAPSGGRTTLRGFVDSQTILPVQLSQLPARSKAVEKRSDRIGYLRIASSLRSAAYTLARGPAGPVQLPPPTAAQRVLDDNKAKLNVEGATKAYVGWHFENNWITRERAIVIWARSEDVDAVRNLVGESIRGVRIDVRRDPRPRRASVSPQAMVAADSGAVLEELAVPTFPGEVSFEAPEPSALLAAKAAKPTVKYQPPKGGSLAPITAEMRLTLHASPEQGWAQLSKFLGSVKDTLVIGMYEFTAPHIERAMLDVSPDKVTLTLDSPPAKGTREQTVEDTEQHLESKLKSRLDFAWALAGLGREAPAKAFPTSYHIKVAVKDGKSFWLSSGNFNTSNQPNINPNDSAALADASRKNDRDWHVICECEALAEVFSKYLLQDFQTAAKAAKAPPRKSKKSKAASSMVAAAAPMLPSVMPDVALVAARAAKSFFPAQVVTGKIQVKPLLTPDDYRKPILELIKSAKRSFFMQTQYIHTVDAEDDGPAPFGGPRHMELITAVADLIRAGVDVRIITSDYQDRSWIEKLQDAGVDAVEHLRIQPHVHNKGIIVDSSVVVVSSQNWSAEGTGANRDAGLIIHDGAAARYFEGIFLHDWVNMAAAKALR